jgi:hypothetical protein
MPTIIVKLDTKRAKRLARWARLRNVSKSEMLRRLIDRAGPVDTGDDLVEWVDASLGRGLDLAQRHR